MFTGEQKQHGCSIWHHNRLVSCPDCFSTLSEEWEKDYKKKIVNSSHVGLVYWQDEEDIELIAAINMSLDANLTVRRYYAYTW